MATISTVFTPERPEGRASHQEQGFIMGWIPGEISSLDDPEKIGRVKVRCDIIEQDTDLPNSTDGWCWVMEEFVNNAVQGGTHRLLKVGAQVALLPMFGDPRQMLLLGCIPSRVDRPHPELDRSKETYGTATAGNVFHMKNDANSSEVQSFPTGVTKTVSPDGSITQQTAEHARMQLNKDGTARIENDKSFTMMTPDGAVQQKSKEGATTTLTADGKVEIKSNTESKLTLDGKKGQMEGPLSDLSQTANLVKSLLAGNLGEAQQLLQLANALTGMITPSGQNESFLIEIDKALTKLKNGLGDNFGKGMEALSKLKGFSPKELGEAIAPQLEGFMESGLGKLAPQLKDAIAQASNVAEILDKVKDLLPPGTLPLEIDKVQAILTGLKHDPEMQLQALLEAVAPDDFRSFQNIMGLDLHLYIDLLVATLDENIPEPKAPPGSKEAIAEHEKNVTTQMSKLRDTMPTLINGNLDDATVRSLVDPKSVAPAAKLEPLNLSLTQPVGSAPVTAPAKTPEPLNISLTQPVGSAPTTPLIDPLATPNLATVAEVAQELKTPNDKIEFIVGKVGTNLTAKSEEKLKPAKDLVESIELLRALGRALKLTHQGADFAKALENLLGTPFGKLVNMKSENLFDHAVKEVLPKAIAQLQKELAPLLKQALEMLNKLLNAIPNQLQGAIVKTMQQGAEIWADPAKKGGQAIIGKNASQLLGPKLSGEKRTEVFAGKKDVGIASAMGKMALGSDGGIFSTAGTMGMRALQDGGASAGLIMGKDGAALSAFFPTNKPGTHNDKPADWGQPSAKMQANEQGVQMQALTPKGAVQNEVNVSSDGIFLKGQNLFFNQVNLQTLLDLPPQLVVLVSQLSGLGNRVTALEAAAAPRIP